MEPVEIIREARNQLFERGWAHGDLIEADGTVCSLGALAVAVYGEDRLRKQSYSVFSIGVQNELLDAIDFVGAAVDETEWGQLPGKVSNTVDRVYCFNDDMKHFDAIVAVFDRAEKIAEDSGVGGVS